MIKTEVSEIKKIYNPTNCCISRLCGCYVDGEKRKLVEKKTAFLSMPEDEIFKYLNILRASLSGGIGKNLINIEFPREAEEKGGAQELLLALRDGDLDDNELLSTFFDKVIESFDCPENYYIILISCTYDVPGKSSDGAVIFDGSSDVYRFIQCAICPVKLSEAGLFYDAPGKNIANRERDWIVRPPVQGFLFPAFNDRESDIHSALYYTKKSGDIDELFVDTVLGCSAPLSANEQKATFCSIVENSLGKECDFDVIKTVQENLAEMLEEARGMKEQPVLDKEGIAYLLESSGASEESLEQFEIAFSEAAATNAEFLVSNIANVKKFEVKTPDVVVKVNPEKTHLVGTRIIDGKSSLVITIEDNNLEVNGIVVEAPHPEKN